MASPAASANRRREGVHDMVVFLSMGVGRGVGAGDCYWKPQLGQPGAAVSTPTTVGMASTTSAMASDTRRWGDRRCIRSSPSKQAWAAYMQAVPQPPPGAGVSTATTACMASRMATDTRRRGGQAGHRRARSTGVDVAVDSGCDYWKPQLGQVGAAVSAATMLGMASIARTSAADARRRGDKWFIGSPSGPESGG